jgi:ATP-dependent Lon protease
VAEKLEIAKRYRVPLQVHDHGLEGLLTVAEESLRRVVTEYTREAGVRELDRLIAKLARKEAKAYLDAPWERPREVDPDRARELLGVPPFSEPATEKQPQIGLAHGLAWTSVGGVTLDIEAVALPGKGKLSLTGQLGEVMKESAQAAIAYVRKNAETFGLPLDFLEKHDLHVHALEGAVPKDGPSAGIAIASAVVSALTGRPLRGDIAMTGEITLRGRVLAIGGVKEKLLAAHQAGISAVIIPAANRAHLEEVPEAIRADLQVHTVSDFDEVVKLMLNVDGAAGFVPLAPAVQPRPSAPQA